MSMGCLWWGVTAVLTTWVLGRISPRIRYVTRYFTFMAYVFFSSLASVPLMFPWKRDSKNATFPAFFTRLWTRLILGVTYEVRGLENMVPEGQGCVLTVNHQSSLDIVAMTYLWPYIPNGHQVTRREVFWFYPIPWLWNTIYLDKLNPEKAQSHINEVGKLISTKQARFAMFPEGTRHDNPTLLPFKKGAFHIAISTQCPIQPVAVSKYHFLDHKSYKFTGGHAVIEVLPAIPTKGLTKADLPELIEKVRGVMQEAFTRNSAATLPEYERRWGSNKDKAS